MYQFTIIMQLMSIALLVFVIDLWYIGGTNSGKGQEEGFCVNFIIRRCEVSDSNAICELNRAELGYDYPENATKEKLEMLLKSRKDKIFVACVDDVVVGYIHANDYDVIYAPHMKNVMGIAVASSCKRQGIGKALLSCVEDWAKNTGADGVRLNSGSKRTAAHDFYRNCGYDEDKQQIRFLKMFG